MFHPFQLLQVWDNETTETTNNNDAPSNLPNSGYLFVAKPMNYFVPRRGYPLATRQIAEQDSPHGAKRGDCSFLQADAICVCFKLLQVFNGETSETGIPTSLESEIKPREGLCGFAIH